MDHDWELIIPGLETLGIEVSNILYNPGNIGNLSFSIVYYPGNIGNWNIHYSQGPGNTGGGRAEAGGRLQGLCCAALDYFWDHVPGILWHVQSQEIVLFPDFVLTWLLFAPIWFLFALIVLIWPYWNLFGLIEPYLALRVKQKRNTRGPHRGHRSKHAIESTNYVFGVLYRCGWTHEQHKW